MHAFAFGAPDEGTWAVGWFPAAAFAPLADGPVISADGVLVAAGAGASRQLTSRLTIAPSGAWHVEGDGVDLRLAEVDRPEGAESPPPGASQPDRLVRVAGSLELAGEREHEYLGWRTSRAGPLEADWESLHQAAAWFSQDDGLAASAAQPRGTRTRADAVVSAAVLGAGACQAEDPRVSSTYGPDGHILRAGLELWLAHGDGDELYPLRAAGEAVGPPVAWETAGVSVEAAPFRWYSRGRDGGGVYLVARR